MRQMVVQHHSRVSDTFFCSDKQERNFFLKSKKAKIYRCNGRTLRVFPRLSPTTCSPAFFPRFVLLRFLSHGSCVFPRLSLATCSPAFFPRSVQLRFPPHPCFPALVTGQTFSRARYRFSVLIGLLRFFR